MPSWVRWTTQVSGVMVQASQARVPLSLFWDVYLTNPLIAIWETTLLPEQQRIIRPYQGLTDDNTPLVDPFGTPVSLRKLHGVYLQAEGGVYLTGNLAAIGAGEIDGVWCRISKKGWDIPENTEIILSNLSLQTQTVKLHLAGV